MIFFTNKVVTVYNKKTCMRLTNAEWYIVEKICVRERIRRKTLFELIACNHSPDINFTAAIRLFVQLYLLVCTKNLTLKPDNSQDILSFVLNKLK